MNRRGFLTGLTAALCAPAIIRTPGLIMPVKVLKTEQYGRSIALMALPDLRMIQEMAFLEGMSQKIVAQFWYGNADLHPFELPGLSGFNEPTRLN
jgi:hypothetical protein